MPDIQEKDADLVGKKFHKGGSMQYVVTALDSELSGVVHWKNLTTDEEGCILASFVRPNLVN